MFVKKIIFFVIFLLYQTTSYSQSVSFNNLNAKNFSKYFSGIIASDNNDNSRSLQFFEETKILLNKHDSYLKNYLYSLILEKKIPKAIKVLKTNNKENDSNFFEAKLLLVIDSIKKGDFDKSSLYINNSFKSIQLNRMEEVILDSLKQYIHAFKEKKILENKKNFGNLSLISNTFISCYLEDRKTDTHYSNLINNNEGDYSRYLYFYISFLVENNRLEDAKKITKEIDYINSTLLISQGKNWLESYNFKKFAEIFSCINHNDIVSEFLFLISNLYASQDELKISNFYLSISNFLNPKFIFNLSLVVENQIINNEYISAKKTLKNFTKEDIFYHWYRKKIEAQIIAEEKNKKQSLNYIKRAFNEIDKPNDKIIFDIANFYKNLKEYDQAIKYYSKILDNLIDKPEIKSDLLYRRGGSYERMGDYEKADKDLIESLKIKPKDAYVLNYLAYSWLERNHNIKEAIEMLKTAYELESDDPYIIDSIGWAYYLVDDLLNAEKFMKRAVELMPYDPIVNDHYGDILWKLNRKIQARYFWNNVLEMEDAEDDMLKKINSKIIHGLKRS